MRWLGASLIAFILAVGLLGLVTDDIEAEARTTLDDKAQWIAGESEANPFILPNSLPDNGGALPPIVVPQDHVYMHSDYSFVPTAGENTELVHSDHNWRDTTWYKNDRGDQDHTNEYISMDLSDNNNLKGDLWVKYTNVGVVEGRTIDLKITLNDWKDFYPQTYNASFRTDEIAFAMQGYEWVDMTWEFIDQGTGDPVELSGYFTFGDIDVNQGISFSPESTQAIDSILLEPEVGDTGSNLEIKENGGAMEIADFATAEEKAQGGDIDVPDDSQDPRHRFSMLYSDESSIRFKWHSNRGSRADPDASWLNPWSSNITPYATGDYLFYELDKPVKTLPSAPLKEGQVDLETSSGTYEISHTVPQESDKFYYDSYMLIDTVQPGLMNPRIVQVEDQFGNDVTDRFTISAIGPIAMASANNDTLNNPDFYGNTYTLTVRTDIDWDYINSQNDGTFAFDNQAIIQNDSRELLVRPGTPPSEIEKEPVNVRHVNMDNGDVLAEEETTMLPMSVFVANADFHGDAYGTEGVLELDHTTVNGEDIGPEQQVRRTVSGDDETNITFYYKSPFQVNHTHIDEDSGETIHVDQHVDEKYKGESWQYDAGLPEDKATFTDNGVEYPYYPVEPRKSGTIDFQNGNRDYRYNVDFEYTKPNIDAGLEYVRIKTDQADSGLPIEIGFNFQSIDEANWGGEDRWASTELNLEIHDETNGDVVYDENHTVSEFREDPFQWTIPAEQLAVDEQYDYSVQLKPVDETELYIRPGHGTINTHGYSASEETVEVSSSGLFDQEASGEWVAMTEAFVGDSEVIEYNEGIDLSAIDSYEMPSGYGHGHINPIQTWTALEDESAPDVQGDVIAQPEISEGDYETNDNGNHIVDVEEHTSSSDDDKTQMTEFTLPQTYVTEGGEGQVVVTDEQPENAVDGGNRLYVPVWVDELGEYHYRFESTEPIGRNHVNVVIDQTVNVESYMFAHTDSETLGKDALLVQPTRDGWFADLFSRDPFEARSEYTWQPKDFTYDGNTVTGLSEEGRAIYSSIPEGTARISIPTENPNTGEPITAIAGTSPSADGSFSSYEFIGTFDAPSVETIGAYAFQNSHFTGQLNAPNLQDVGQFAFYNSQFTGPLEASDLTSVDNSAFYHSQFDSLPEIDNVGTDAFYHSNTGE